MSIAKAIGVIGAAMGGYAQGRRQYLRDEEDRKDREVDRQYKQARNDSMQQDLSDRTELRLAAMDQGMQDANAGPMPEGQAVRFGGKGFAEASDAQPAVDAANTPKAKMARTLGVMAGIDPVKAQQMQKQGLEIEAAQDDGKRRRMVMHAAKAALGGWDAIREFYDTDYDDGLKTTFEKKPDGSAVFSFLDKDGKPSGEPFTMKSPQDFIGIAASYGDPNKYLDRLERKEERVQEQDRWSKEHGLRERGVAADERRAAAGTEFKLPPGVKERYDLVANQLETVNRAIAEAQANGSFDPEAPGAKALLSQKAALSLQARQIMEPFTPEAGNADPLGLRPGAPKAVARPTPSRQPGPSSLPQDGVSPQSERDRDAAAIRFQEAGGDPARIAGEVASLERELKTAKGDQRAILQTELNLWRAAAGMAPQTGKRPNKAVSQGVGAPVVAPAPEKTRPKAKERNVIETTLARLSEMGQDYSTPEGKAALSRRVNEASKGGAPLSDVEKLRAQQQGLR